MALLTQSTFGSVDEGTGRVIVIGGNETSIGIGLLNASRDEVAEALARDRDAVITISSVTSVAAGDEADAPFPR